MVTRTRLNVTLYVQCLSCCNYVHTYSATVFSWKSFSRLVEVCGTMICRKLQHERTLHKHIRCSKLLWVRFICCADPSKKISPIRGPRCPEGFRKLRFPDYVTMAQDSGKVASLRNRPLFTPRKYSWYSFLLEAESTLMSMKNSNNTTWNRTSDLPICSTAP